jgi:hypothetical protein
MWKLGPRPRNSQKKEYINGIFVAVYTAQRIKRAKAKLPLKIMEVNFKPIRVRLPETDGEEVAAGEVLAAQLTQLIQPPLHPAPSRQLIQAEDTIITSCSVL